MNKEILCPKCGCDQLTANKKGFSGKKAVAGAALTGAAIGLLAGTIGSNKIKITCLNCGNEFKPGQGAKTQAEVFQKKKSDSNAGVVAFIVLIILVAIGIFSKNSSSDKEKSKAETTIYGQNSSPELKQFQQDMIYYEATLNRIHNSAQDELNKFDAKWMTNKVSNVKGFKSDAEKIKQTCESTKKELENIAVPNVPKEFGDKIMNSVVARPKEHLSEAYGQLYFFYSDYKYFGLLLRAVHVQNRHQCRAVLCALR